MSFFEVYTKPGCKYCEDAIQILTNRKVDFEVLVLNKDYTIEYLNWRLPKVTTVPQIFFNDEYIGDLQNLKAYFNI